MMDNSGAAKSDGNCTSRELRIGLKNLTKKGGRGFSEGEVSERSKAKRVTTSVWCC